MWTLYPLPLFKQSTLYRHLQFFSSVRIRHFFTKVFRAVRQAFPVTGFHHFLPWLYWKRWTERLDTDTSSFQFDRDSPDRKKEIGYPPLVRRFIGPKVYWSEGSLVRRCIGSKVYWSELVRRFISSKMKKRWFFIFRTSAPSDQWAFGLVNLFCNFWTSEPSDQWSFGLMNLRTNDTLWNGQFFTFGPASFRTYEPSD